MRDKGEEKTGTKMYMRSKLLTDITNAISTATQKLKQN